MDEQQVTLLEQETKKEEVVSQLPESFEYTTVKKRARHAAPTKPTTVVKRVFGGIGIALLSVIVLVVATFLFIFYSPWTHEYRDQYILMTYHTSNPWLCTWFFSQETIDEVLDNNSFKEPEPVIPNEPAEPDEPDEPNEPAAPIEFATSDKYPAEVIYDDGEVQIIKFSGTTSKGKYTARLIQVKDPSRMTLGVTKNVGDKDNPTKKPGKGQIIADMCKDNDALCGINAGGWVDINGVGTGGIPLGTVVKDGVMTVYTEEENHTIIGFDYKNRLVMGKFNPYQVASLGIRDAVSWREPAVLIRGGVMAEFSGLAGGYDPRSAIGQREDGMVLLLVVDGSSKRSIDGANFALMADILHEFGAINAANLDGGTSSSMALNGKIINTVCNPAIVSRGRYLATTWLVKNVSEDDVQTDATTTTVVTGDTTTVLATTTTTQVQ